MKKITAKQSTKNSEISVKNSVSNQSSEISDGNIDKDKTVEQCLTIVDHLMNERMKFEKDIYEKDSLIKDYDEKVKIMDDRLTKYKTYVELISDKEKESNQKINTIHHTKNFNKSSY